MIAQYLGNIALDGQLMVNSGRLDEVQEKIERKKWSLIACYDH